MAQRPGTDPEAMLAAAAVSWGAVLLFGVVTLLFGIAAMFFTEGSLKVIAFLFGLYLLVVGVFRFLAAFAPHESGGERALTLLVGLLALALGIFAMRNTVTTVKLFGILLGLFWLIDGVVMFFQAVAHRGTPSRGWKIFLGVVTAIAGIVLVAYPGISLGTLTVLVGIWLMILGVIEILVAFQLKKRLPAVA